VSRACSWARLTGVCKVTQDIGMDPSRVERTRRELRQAAEVLGRAIEELSQGSPAPHGPTEDILKTMYQEVCRHHQSISEFRGKLLSLVPIASGAFIGLITAKVDWSRSGPLLVAAGVAGALVTAGLYLYEAWQSDTCRHLIHHAKFLEQELRMEAGQFRTLRPKARIREVYPRKVYECREQYLSQLEQKGVPFEQYSPYLRQPEQPSNHPIWKVGAEMAGFVVYGAVFVAWLVVAGFGVAALFVS
jgi:hypothetical protein